MRRYGKPEIFNSDQGSQFTSEDFIKRLTDEKNVKISMDSRGRAYDNIFVERLWWAVKYEDIYLHDYQDIPECKRGLEKYFGFYNTERRHQSLDYKTPWKYILKAWTRTEEALEIKKKSTLKRAYNWSRQTRPDKGGHWQVIAQ